MKHFQVISAFLVPLALTSCGLRSQNLPTVEVELGGEIFLLEVAQTPNQQARGLMYRDSLPDNHGMLFPVDPPRPMQLWMKNVEFSLDMIFIADGEVVEIVEEAPPCSEDPCPLYGPDTVVDAVIEIKGGLANEVGVEVGYEPAI